jgi:hypothetical protein
MKIFTYTYIYRPSYPFWLGFCNLDKSWFNLRCRITSNSVPSWIICYFNTYMPTTERKRKHGEWISRKLVFSRPSSTFARCYFSLRYSNLSPFGCQALFRPPPAIRSRVEVPFQCTWCRIECWRHSRVATWRYLRVWYENVVASIWCALLPKSNFFKCDGPRTTLACVSQWIWWWYRQCCWEWSCWEKSWWN